MSMHFAAGKITVGDHVATTKIFGLTINLDIVWASVIAGAIVLALGFAVRAKVTKGVPGKLQLAYETIVEQIWVHIESVKARGWRGYLSHYAQPYKAMIPINIIEELTKPITLTFRLFGNIFSGGLMVVVMATLLPWYASFVGQMIWKPFDLGIGLIQAFIFALLTILYFGMAMSHEEH